MSKRSFILIIVISFVIFSTTIYALNVSGNKNFSVTDAQESNNSFQKTIKMSLDTFVYAGFLNKSSGERIIIKKRLKDIINNEEIESEDKKISYMRRIKDSEKDVDMIYDSRIFNIWDNKSSVHVYIKLKDKSKIIVQGTPEQKENLSIQRSEWFKQEKEKVLAGFSQGEFNLTLDSSRFFEGDISQEGFSKLLNDPRIEEIYDITNAPLAHATLHQSVSLINVNPGVWNLGYTGNGIDVCVIDTGINADHPDLSGKVADEYCSCSGNCCPNNQDEDFTSAEDDNGHGTHVAGIIASQDATYKGVAPDIDLYIAKVLDENGDLYSWGDVDNAIDWCISNNVDIISISIGTDTVYTEVTCPTLPADSGIEDAYTGGIFIDASSGNAYSTSGISYPSCHEDVVSVGASTKLDILSLFTNRKLGLLDLLAPGYQIYSLDYDDYINPSIKSGTSQAAPHVAGAAALLLEADPSLTPAEIKSYLVDNGENIDGYPRINVLAAINALTGEGEEGQLSDCTESGYEFCIEYEVDNCDVSIAENLYGNVNDIFWGEVNDDSDPYVTESYTIGWKDVDAEKMYYDCDGDTDCDYGGCDCDEIDDEGTMITVTASGIAYRDEILGYDDTDEYACWVWWYPFYPNYGQDNSIYVLKCFSDNDCSANQYCDKSSGWSNWECVTKKSDGQSCTLDSQCTSGYCDNDGVGSSDDNWCFTPYNIYFDGQENTKCEISTGHGEEECDEIVAGTGNCNAICNYVDDSIGYCYQESANVSTACGGLDTGKYSLVGDGWVSHGPGLVVDKIWSTYGSADSFNTHGLVYINYSKPSNSTSLSLWQVKIGSCSTPTFTNLTIPSSCWNYNQTAIFFLIKSDNYQTFGNSRAYCYSGSWQLLLNETGDNCLFEEGMNWHIDNSTSIKCYQEFANVSTACGGLDTGKYSYTGVWTNNPPTDVVSNGYDGDWATGASILSGGTTGHIKINYTKPTNAQNTSKWMIKAGMGATNMSIPISCWDYSETVLSLDLEAYAKTSPYHSNFSCYNGTGFVIVNETLDGYPGLFEEAMVWNISTS